MKDIHDLLKKNPDLFHRCYKDEAFKKPYKITVVLCQPRSGSTLLLRLMNSACLTHMIGDRPLEFYQGQIMMWKALKEPGIYGHPINLEIDGVFPDEYRGTSKLREEYLFRYVVALNSGDGNHRCGYSKTTLVGFANDLVEDYVEMLTELYSGTEYDLTIAFLTRDHHEIVRSFQTTEGPAKETSNKHPEHFHKFLEDQFNQFQNVRDLDHPWITYDQLISDPIKQLQKLNPVYAPIPCMVEEIMSKRLRQN